MTGLIDAHHHLWNLSAVHYPWLMEHGAARFFGDPTPIQRDYLIKEFRANAAPHGITASVHIQVGAAAPHSEAAWVQQVADASPDWPLVQVAFCDLTAPDLNAQLDRLQTLPSLRGVRQIVGRAPGEDAQTGTNSLLDDPRFLAGLQEIGRRGLSFDLQLIPELMQKTARVLEQAPDTPVALCHAGSPHDRSPAGLAEWATQMRALSALDHVRCKISGLGMFDHGWTRSSIAPIVEEVLGQFGPDRCMFGSNFPVDSLYSDYATLFSAISELVPKDMHAAVFHDTAAKFYAVL
jgi:predicted TIM-barrel fold metal-dependent hydrolase